MTRHLVTKEDVPIRRSVRVSVLMTLVRMDEFVRPAIRSVLSDLGPHDELVVVGDGLRLGSLDMELDGRAVLIELDQRLGTPSALNAGIDNAQGRFIARLDADDISLPGRFDAQVAEFERRKDLVLLGGGAILVDEVSGVEQMFPVPVGSSVLKSALLRRNAFVHSSVMMRADALDAAGKYDPRLLRMQDYDLFMKLSTLGEIDNLPQPLVKYRIHGDMASRTNSPYTSYTRLILARRRWLSRKVGTHTVVVMWRDFAWWIAQVLRYHGLRRPRGRVVAGLKR